MFAHKTNLRALVKWENPRMNPPHDTTEKGINYGDIARKSTNFQLRSREQGIVQLVEAETVRY